MDARAWVYMLRCADGRYYVGSHRGEEVAARVWEHQAGVHPKAWTFKRRPVELVWCGSFEMITDAIGFERQLKGWSRAKKEALIAGDWNEVSRLSRGPNCKAPEPWVDRIARLARARDVDG